MDSVVFQRIKELCDENNITINKLESETGMSQSSISRWRGASSPTVNKLLRVARRFNVSMDYLVGRTNVRTMDCNKAFVCDYLNLSEKSIEALRNLREINNWDDVLTHILDAVTIMTKQKSE